MTATVVTIPIVENPEAAAHSEARVRILVHIQAEVLEAEVARRIANEWLLANAGNHLSATKPEIVLDERLLWRFEVILGFPNVAQPGSGALYRVGQILLDAASGEIQEPELLAEELQTSASSIVH